MTVDTEGAFKEANAALHAIGVTYWMDCGTLLGAVRDGGFMAHDPDVDFGVADHPALCADIISEVFVERGFAVHHLYGTIERGFQQSFKLGATKVDVFYFYEHEDRDDMLSQWSWMQEGGAWQEIISDFKSEIVLPPQAALFAGQRTFMPASPPGMLEARYGDWRVVKTQWDYRTDPKCIRR